VDGHLLTRSEAPSGLELPHGMAGSQQDYAGDEGAGWGLCPAGKGQVYDAYLGGERCGGKPGRGSENKVPIVAAVSVDDAGHPRYVKLATVATFSFAAIADWAQDSLAIECSDLRWAGLLSRRDRSRLPASSCGRERTPCQ
jgi:hypothetical protein